MGLRITADEVRTGLPVPTRPAPVPTVDIRPTALAGFDPAPPRRGRAVIPVLLVAGWGGLFAYCATYLREDLPFRPVTPPEGSVGAEDAPRRAFVLPDVPGASPREAPPPQALAAVPSVPAPSAPAPSAPASPPRPAASPGEAAYVGTWGPTPAACGRPSRRRGYLPATITADWARAGRTLCAFRDGHRAGNAWVMAADCSDRGRRWSSQVRLLVEGDHLTWSSSRGTASYTRCARRTGG